MKYNWIKKFFLFVRLTNSWKFFSGFVLNDKRNIWGKSKCLHPLMRWTLKTQKHLIAVLQTLNFPFPLNETHFFHQIFIKMFFFFKLAKHLLSSAFVVIYVNLSWSFYEKLKNWKNMQLAGVFQRKQFQIMRSEIIYLKEAANWFWRGGAGAGWSLWGSFQIAL